MINLVILGSTGSIGSQALALADMYPELIRIRGIAADTGGEAFKAQIAKYKPDYAALANKDAARNFDSCGTKLLSGPEGICELARLDSADMVLVSIVGIAGLDAVIAALKAGKRVALANKEALVAGGECVMRLAGRAGERLLPVDSEPFGGISMPERRESKNAGKDNSNCFRRAFFGLQGQFGRSNGCPSAGSSELEHGPKD